MASVMFLNDFMNLLPFYGLQVDDFHPPINPHDELNVHGVCPLCKTKFSIELLECDEELIFNFEDLLCPNNCNHSAVGAADFMEQVEFDRLEDFFAPVVEDVPMVRDDLLHYLAQAVSH